MPKNLFYTIILAVILACCIQQIMQKEMLFVSTPDVDKSPIYTAHLDKEDQNHAMSSPATFSRTESNEYINIEASEELATDGYDLRILKTDLVHQGDIESGQKAISVECITPQTISTKKEKSTEEAEVSKDYKIIGKIIQGIVKSLDRQDDLKKKFRSIKQF